MRRPAATLLLLMATAGLAAAAGPEAVQPARLQQQFHEAGRAYDEGRMPDAVRLYEDLIGRGYAAMEVSFNLGNASFKGGRLGPAVLHYRRAWRLAPRDPDTAANLRFALQAGGVSEPVLSGPESLFTRLTEQEWILAAMAGWWAACLFLGLAIFFRARRGLSLRLAAGAGFVTLVALLGVWTWRGFAREPEVVVMESAQQALYAPLATSTPHFPVPEGSVLRAREFQGDWVKVALGDRTGWIRRAVCAPVLLNPTADAGAVRPPDR